MESSKQEYFVDGFMLKYFQVWPEGLDKENLLDSQKIFLVYLMGSIPELTDWNRQVDYERKLKDIENNTKIVLSETDIDLANLQEKNIEELKAERLRYKKEELKRALNKEFGIKEKPRKQPALTIEEKEEKKDEKKPENQKTKLWDMLHGKGLTKNG